jgi:hypothetical protein
MKLYVDTSTKQVTVSKEPVEKTTRTAVRGLSVGRAGRCGRRRCSSWTMTGVR